MTRGLSVADLQCCEAVSGCCCRLVINAHSLGLAVRMMLILLSELFIRTADRLHASAAANDSWPYIVNSLAIDSTVLAAGKDLSASN